MKSARAQWTNGVLPWDSCAYGANYVTGTYGLGEVPEVTATLGYCKANCPGVQLSTVDQWLGLLTSWILPAIGLLLTCSTGWKTRAYMKDNGPSRSTPSWWFNRVHDVQRATRFILRWVPNQLQEFMAILGDPAGAIRGAFSEVALNLRMVHDIYYPGDFDRLVMGLAIVAGQTRFTEFVDARLTYFILKNGTPAAIDSIVGVDAMADLKKALKRFTDSKEEQLLIFDSPIDEVGQKIKRTVIKHVRWTLVEETEDSLRNTLQALRECVRCDADKKHPAMDCLQCTLHDEIVNVLNHKFSRVGELRVLKRSKWAEDLQSGVRVILQGRVDFMKGIVLPIILGLVATAASFYSAYNQIGDNNTAHTLAYGVWYSWSIIVAVVSNCYVATTNPGVARLALNYDFLSEITVPLRERSENTQKWRKWLQDIGCSEQGHPDQTPAFPEDVSFWSESWSLLRVLTEQTLAWVCIGMPCACAASISYTTPTVGLGCRSFTFLLFGICTLVVSWLSAYRAQLLRTTETWSQRVCLRALYILGICVNVFIISIGTICDLIGLYRTCRCNSLFASDNFLLQMSSNTALDVANAKKFWLPIGYLDFGFVWIVCMIAVSCRTYIAYSINLLLEKWDEARPGTALDDLAPQVENDTLLNKTGQNEKGVFDAISRPVP